MMDMMDMFERICADNCITLHSTEGFERIGGVAMSEKKGTKNRKRDIGYFDKLEGFAKYLTIAHELGHHALGHLDDDVYLGFKGYGKNRGDVVERREREAQTFAAAFMAMALFMQYMPDGKADAS
jgi:Zn-dependent peptidase ImmA (M78 family)